MLPRLLPQTGYSAQGKFMLYASYASSFTPQTSSLPRADSGRIEPLVGTQYEAGTKLSLLDSRLFEDPDLPGMVLQIGKVHARGIEAEAQGEILPGWRINGGYTFNKNEYFEDTNPLYEGISFVAVISRLRTR